MDSSLTALSPVDGRYRAATEGLAQLLSESGLVRERIRVEALWTLQLGDVPDTYADVEDLVRDVGYKPATTVEEGIKAFVEWYREYYRV